MRRRGERGTTLVELMIAGTVLLVALLGFAGMASSSAASTGVAHRRGSAVYAQAGLIDRYLMSTRSTYANFTAPTWVIDSCYDVNGQVVAGNPSYSSTFACPAASTFYRTWIWLQGTGPWVLSVYAERVDRSCTPATRFTSIGCVATDVYLSD